MPLILVSFLAGIITIAAPCILPLLPIIIGGSISREGQGQKKNSDRLRPLIIAGSLAVSVIVFTLLLKATTVLLGVPAEVWQWISGLIIILLGLGYLLPNLWEQISLKLKLSSGANKSLSKASRRGGLAGSVLTGAALGPVFNSCSPTYALIVGIVIPRSFTEGFIYLAAYAVGLSMALLAVAYLGRSFLNRFKKISNPKSLFKKVLGGLFILVGLAIIFGWDKDLQSYILQKGWYSPVSGFEEKLR